ncbi:MAG TPA: hypothetical protein VMT15_07850 [Bryobacteraceae bacterium]|nr:hypothetical protein [Bryobacteraceae bacterium]
MASFGRALFASFCLQTAALAGYANHPAVAEILCVAAGISMILGVQAAGGGIDPRTQRRLRDALVTFMLVGGVLRLIFAIWPFGGNGVVPSANPEAASNSESPTQKETDAATDRGGGDHTGVILLTEPQPIIALVPPLPSMTANLFDSKHPNPLSIPFYGAYWFFKFPDSQPPLSSYVTHGTPVQMSFRAPDRRPLLMEAHQNLGKLISLECCREIRIEIRNADPFPGTVWVELVLIDTIDTREGQQASLSLGRTPVTSAPEPDAASPPMKETLTFPIPAHPSIKRFDELAIRFPRQRTRADRSAKIAIERFVLVPRA